MKLLLSIVASLTVVTSLPASAANPFRAVELTDAQLSELRGRYVMPGRIIHFGVTMGTLWENGAGQSLGRRSAFMWTKEPNPVCISVNFHHTNRRPVTAPALSRAQVLLSVGRD